MTIRAPAARARAAQALVAAVGPIGRPGVDAVGVEAVAQRGLGGAQRVALEPLRVELREALGGRLVGGGERGLRRRR